MATESVARGEHAAPRARAPEKRSRGGLPDGDSQKRVTIGTRKFFVCLQSLFLADCCQINRQNLVNTTRRQGYRPTQCA